MHKKETVLILGASGFIGQRLKYKLSSENYNLALTYNNSKLDAPRCVVIQKDLSSDSMINEFLKIKPDIVINCTGLNPSVLQPKDDHLFYQFNRNATTNLAHDFLMYSNSIENHEPKKFINLSTYEIYGNIKDISGFNELSGTNPLNAYADSKAQAIKEIEELCKEKLRFINVICTNNFGPGQSNDKLIPIVYNKLINNQKIIINGDGSSQRTWTYVDDTCKGIIQILKHGNHSRYHLSSHNHVSVIGVIKSIHTLLKSKQIISTDSAQLDWQEADCNPVFKIDSSWSEKQLNWNAKTSFIEGLDRTIEYLRTQRNEK